MNIEYSVIIRTTGKAGEKYQALLDSIKALEPKPAEVIVVLPEGFELPPEKLGWETFYFSKKGMVTQRMVGIDKCKTQYALICDDDMKFDPDFVQKLYQPIADGICQISAGPLYSLLPRPGMVSVICTVMASAPATILHKDRYISILRTSGYSYNRKLDSNSQRIYESQSLSWGCFFAETRAIHNIQFEAETWIETHGYAALDDQTMFYKAWLRGIKSGVVPDALYEHLDAGTSSRSNQAYVQNAIGHNRIIFWNRFLLEQQKNWISRLWTRICFGYCLLCGLLFDLAMLCIKHDKKTFFAKYQGMRSGWQYIKSEAYRSLPPVCQEVTQ